MRNNGKAFFGMRRMIAAGMAVLVMLGANATSLTAENEQGTENNDEPITETVESSTTPEAEETEESKKLTVNPESKTKEGEPEGEPKETAGEEEKPGTEETLVNPTTEERKTDTTEAPETPAEEKTLVGETAPEEKQETAELTLDVADLEINEESTVLESKVAETEETGETAEEPVAVAVEPLKELNYEFKYSIGKTATNLDSNYETEVTLSLPSAERQLESDVVFAIDKSSYSDGPQTIENALTLLNAIVASNAKVKVNIVIFNRTGHPGKWLDPKTQFSEIETLLKTELYSGGSNMHAGLLAAKEVLESDTSVPDDRKYLVLISDGSTYLHCKDNDYTIPYTRSFMPINEACYVNSVYGCGGFYVDGYYPASSQDGNKARPTTDNKEDWIAYLKDVKERNAESMGDQFDYVWEWYDSWNKGNVGLEYIGKTYKQTPSKPRTATNMDISFLKCYETWQELQKYHTYTVCVKDNGAPGMQGSAIGFMRFLNNNHVPDFEKIKNEILYYVSKGTTVQDFMGFKKDDYNFNLKDPTAMKLEIETVVGDKKDTKKFDAVKIADNSYGFCPNESGYDFVVDYSPDENGENENLVWHINRNISNFERVKLIYKEVLKNPKTEPGTYGQYDENGSKGYKELFTNRSAVLHPIDSVGEEGADQEFPMPTVSYTVKETPTPTPTSTSTPTPTSKPTPTPEPESNPKSTPTPTPDYVVTCQMAGYPADYVWNENVKACVPGFRRTKVPNTSDKGLTGSFVSFLFSTVTGVAAAYILKKY